MEVCRLQQEIFASPQENAESWFAVRLKPASVLENEDRLRITPPLDTYIQIQKKGQGTWGSGKK
jgi:hypothetical protein